MQVKGIYILITDVTRKVGFPLRGVDLSDYCGGAFYVAAIPLTNR